MAALDARRVEEAGVVADQRASREDQLRQRLQAARRDRARAVRNSLSAGEEISDRGMSLETLELLVRGEVGILVAEADDVADRDLVVLHVIQERPAVGIGIKRPACGMHDESRPVFFRLDVPKLLEADAILLGVGPLSQPVFFLELAPELAAAAFGE